MKDFDEVENCRNVEELNHFIREYLDERKLTGEPKRKTYWALFYRWKESLERPEV